MSVALDEPHAGQVKVAQRFAVLVLLGGDRDVLRAGALEDMVRVRLFTPVQSLRSCN